MRLWLTELERVSEVQYADELLNLLDQHATPVEVFAKAKRDFRDLFKDHKTALLIKIQSIAFHCNFKIALYPFDNSAEAVRDVVGQLMGATNADGTRQKHSVLGNDATQSQRHRLLMKL